MLSFELPAVSVDLGRYRMPMLVGAGVLALVLVLATGDALMSWGRVHPGVTVGGVAVGGKSLSQTRGELEREVGPRLKLPVTVAHESSRWTIKPASVEASLDAQTAAEAAFAVGRSGGLARRIAERASAWFGAAALPLAARADDAKLDAAIRQIQKAVDVPPHDATVTVEGTKVTLEPAKSGMTVRADRLRRQLLAALVAQARIVPLKVGYAPVSVTDEDAQRALADAKQMVSDDIRLTFENKSWVVPAAKVGSWIEFRPVRWTADATTSPAGPYAATIAASITASPSVVETATAQRRMVLVAYVNAREVSSTLEPLVTGVGKPAIDARFKPVGKRVEIVPGQVGIGIDAGKLAVRLDQDLRGTGDRTFPMTLTQTQPKLTTERAQAMGVKELISTYSTDYDPGNAPRVNNIHTLAKALDGKLVPPGGTFSFNGAVGERTAERGYQEAPAIVNGRLVPQLGGGICQIGTTFFNAVFFSGLPVVERSNHSFYISHYPKGRDCTVNWGGPDFRWRNETKSWILVDTSFDSGSVTIALYGTDPGYKVAYTTGPFTGVTHYATIKENDPTLAFGKTVVSDSGVDGRKVVVVRTVTKNGAVVRKDTFTSLYKPKDEVVKVGTLKPSLPATSTPTTPTR